MRIVISNIPFAANWVLEIEIMVLKEATDVFEQFNWAVDDNVQ
jgi:hypothetical protein